MILHSVTPSLDKYGIFVDGADTDAEMEAKRRISREFFGGVAGNNGDYNLSR